MTPRGQDAVLMDRAERLYESGRCDEALALLAAAAGEGPEALLKQAEYLLDSGQPAAARERLQRAAAAEADPRRLVLQAACAAALGDFDEAGRLTEEARGGADLGAEGLVIRGLAALGRGRSAEARACFEQAAARDDRCGSAWFRLALLEESEGRPDQALEFMAQGLARTPQAREIGIAFHDLAVRTGHLQRAQEAFRRAVAQRPYNRRLRFFLIDVLLRRGRWAEAMDLIESAIVDFGTDDGILAAAAAVRERVGPFGGEAGADAQSRVSLCMIAKNEREHLAGCLRSAKPFVDEIVLVDTGSADGTPDIARVFGARVFHLPWADDFSEARNFALSQAVGGWVLVLDADEVLSMQDLDRFRRLMEEARRRPAAFRVRTRNYSNRASAIGFQLNKGEFSEERGLGWYPSDKVRLFPNHPRIRFDYPVHELVEPSLQREGIPVRDCSLVVHHYGTLREDRVAEKSKSYQRLAHKKLAGGNCGAAALRELAVQATQLGSHDEALSIWRRFIQLEPHSPEAYLNMGAICWQLGRYGEALAFSKKALAIDPAIKEAGFNTAFALLMLGDAQGAATNLHQVLKLQPDYPAARFLLCVAYACLGDAAESERAFEGLRALPLAAYLHASFEDVAKRLASAARTEYARRTLEAANRLGCAEADLPSKPVSF